MRQSSSFRFLYGICAADPNITRKPQPFGHHFLDGSFLAPFHGIRRGTMAARLADD